MGLSLIRRVFARYPGLRWGLAAVLQRVPAFDRRVRSAFARMGSPPSPLRIDAAHLPEDAAPVQRALVDAIAKASRR
jgi:hypothetical protein